MRLLLLFLDATSLIRLLESIVEEVVEVEEEQVRASRPVLTTAGDASRIPTNALIGDEFVNADTNILFLEFK